MKHGLVIRCGLCQCAPSRSRIAFAYEVPEATSQRHSGADLLTMDMNLCRECAGKVFKHMKRFFGVRYFSPKRRHAPIKDDSVTVT